MKTVPGSFTGALNAAGGLAETVGTSAPDTQGVIGFSPGTGTFTGTTLVFEYHLFGGSVWYPLQVTDRKTGVKSNGTVSPADNSTNSWAFALRGADQIRAWPNAGTISATGTIVEITTGTLAEFGGLDPVVQVAAATAATFSAGITLNGASGANTVTVPAGAASAVNFSDGTNTGYFGINSSTCSVSLLGYSSGTTAVGGTITGAGGAGGATSGAGGAITWTGGAGTNGNAAGGAYSGIGGAGQGSAAGGAANLTGGLGGATGAGGAVVCTGGAGGATSGTGGAFTAVGGVGTAGNSAGGVGSVTGGAGQGSAAGGIGKVVGGAGGATGAGGAAQLTGGAGGATSGTGGAATVVAGAGTNGNAAGGVGSLAGGAGNGTGAGGAVSVTGGASGAGASGNGGAASLVGGASLSTAGTGGAVTITAGASAGAGGTAGSVAIDAGAATGGTAGSVTIGGTNATSIAIGSTTCPVVLGGPWTSTPGGSTAAAGSTNADAATLPAGTASFYPTTAANGTKGVIISANDKVTGREFYVGNGVANAVLKIYAPSGGTINGGSANAAFSSVSGSGIWVFCLSGSGNTWHCS